MREHNPHNSWGTGSNQASTTQIGALKATFNRYTVAATTNILLRQVTFDLALLFQASNLVGQHAYNSKYYVSRNQLDCHPKDSVHRVNHRKHTSLSFRLAWPTISTNKNPMKPHIASLQPWRKCPAIIWTHGGSQASTLNLLYTFTPAILPNIRFHHIPGEMRLRRMSMGYV